MEGKTSEKRNEQLEEIEKNGRKELWGLNFLRNTKLFLSGRTKRLYWMRVLRGFGGFI